MNKDPAGPAVKEGIKDLWIEQQAKAVQPLNRQLGMLRGNMLTRVSLSLIMASRTRRPIDMEGSRVDKGARLSSANYVTVDALTVAARATLPEVATRPVSRSLLVPLGPPSRMLTVYEPMVKTQ